MLNKKIDKYMDENFRTWHPLVSGLKAFYNFNFFFKICLYKKYSQVGSAITKYRPTDIRTNKQTCKETFLLNTKNAYNLYTNTHIETDSHLCTTIRQNYRQTDRLRADIQTLKQMPKQTKSYTTTQKQKIYSFSTNINILLPQWSEIWNMLFNILIFQI